MIFLLTNEDKILFEGMRKEFHARVCLQVGDKSLHCSED